MSRFAAEVTRVRPRDVAGAQALADLCSGLGRDDLAAAIDDWPERESTRGE